MKLPELNTVDDVISLLKEIILDSEKNEDPLGYFAALYQRVTQKVKEGIENNFFEDGPRMEKLDVVFAKRYIEAWNSWKMNEPVTKSWKKAFIQSKNYRPIVLQHLLLGMNAHINLDLGIAAAEISAQKEIQELKNDFYKINEILSSLVNEIQNNLAVIWPTLKKILSITGKVDNFLIDFSMELARDGAWNFAQTLSSVPSSEWNNAISVRDSKVAEKSGIIIRPKYWIQLILLIIRFGEKGSVAKKIKSLKSGS